MVRPKRKKAGEDASSDSTPPADHKTVSGDAAPPGNDTDSSYATQGNTKRVKRSGIPGGVTGSRSVVGSVGSDLGEGDENTTPPPTGKARANASGEDNETSTSMSSGSGSTSAAAPYSSPLSTSSTPSTLFEAETPRPQQPQASGGGSGGGGGSGSSRSRPFQRSAKSSNLNFTNWKVGDRYKLTKILGHGR